MPDLQQYNYECTICYETFDELDHRPLTLICDNNTCGHTYCLRCVQEISKMSEPKKCPSCNAVFKYTTTNWFVIDLIKNQSYDIDNPHLEQLVNELHDLQIQLGQYSRFILFAYNFFKTYILSMNKLSIV